MAPINYREVPMDKELKVSLPSNRVKLELQLRAFAEQTRRHPVSYSGWVRDFQVYDKTIEKRIMGY